MNMAIVGIGMDAIELERIRQAMKKRERFAERILTAKEKELFQMMMPNRQVEFLAGRFAAKEAYAKALGTGIGKAVSFLEIEILPNEKGQPLVHCPAFEGKVWLSITHTKEVAYAYVIFENKDFEERM